jgi:RNA polymerase sigma factor (sigma-70 family)
MNRLTSEQKQRLAEWALRFRKELLRRAQNFSGWKAHDAEDVVQHVLLKAVSHIATLETWPDEDILRYLSRATTNYIQDVKRRPQTESGIEGILETIPMPPPEPRDWCQVSDQEWAAAIDQLPSRVREAYRLRREGLSYQAIATRMGVTPGCVGGWLAQARELLREKLVSSQDRERRSAT